MKSNKGPVNQRILTSSYDNFTQIYGEPENLDDFGHFAAENYLAISNQLLCVRATMGDEGYAQIQYPYTDADSLDKFTSKDTAEFKYINNEDDFHDAFWEIVECGECQRLGLASWEDFYDYFKEQNE